MIINEKIIAKNYKCFDAEGGGFDSILPINIIIGKNNSGKSSLIDLVKFLIVSNKEFITIGRGKSKSEVLVEHLVQRTEISRIFHVGSGGGGIPGSNHLDYGNNFVGKKLTYAIDENGKPEFKELDAEFVPQARHLFESLAHNISTPLAGKTFCHITAERDIIPEPSSNHGELKENGTGATNYIQNIINKDTQESDLIEEELLRELNNIINPEINFTRIYVQSRDGLGTWEIFFIDDSGSRIALSKMGSGIKTVILVLLNLIVRPSIENKKKDQYVFAFEELENNLHPALQRRMYEYIRKYSEKNKTYFFLTTHSNIVIDAFGADENAQMIHIKNDKIKSTVSTVLTVSQTKEILNDLDIKASDLLQSNGVIWVEGPSDRIYVNKWIGTISPEIREGLHYVIMFYGGRLLSNLSFDYDWFNKEIIPLLRINTNAFVIMDRDGKSSETMLNATKKRVINEVGVNNYWVTEGREIENYLSNDIISKWLKDKKEPKSNFVNRKNIKLENNIINSNDKIKVKYNENKSGYSTEISKLISEESMNVLDLKENIEKLISRIKVWNSIENNKTI